MVSAVIGVEHIHLSRTHVTQTTDITSVASTVLGTVNLRHVVMERMPQHPSKAGADPWNKIYLMLQMNDYQVVSGTRYDITSGRTIYVVSPSQWKPFMKTRMDPKQFKTSGMPVPHARDAAAMLHYFIQMNHPEKRIYYA